VINPEVATYADVTVFVDPARGLLERRGGKTVVLRISRTVTVSGLDVGPDANGDPVAVYARCAPSCDIYLYDLKARRERRVPEAAKPGISERRPSIWRGRLIFERGENVMMVEPGSGRPARALLKQTYGLDDLELGPTAVAYAGQFETEDGDSQTEVDVVPLDHPSGGIQLDQAFVGEGSSAGFGGITAEADGTFAWLRASRNGCSAIKRVLRAGGLKVRAHTIPAARAPLAARSASPQIPDTPESESC
jgi:hypothetical protein